MSSIPLACIGAAGLACPLGTRRRAVAAAVRAGIQRYLESDEVSDGAGEPVRACRLEALEQGDRLERALWFTREALAGLGEEWHALGGSFPEPVPAFIVGPDPSVGPVPSTSLLQRRLADHLPEGLSLRLGPTSMVEGGRAGLFAAFERALAVLGGGREPMVLVGGLDCLTAAAVLQELADRNRVLGKLNGDGLLPGEGAGFVLLASPRHLSPRRAPALLWSLASARDPHPFDGPEPGRGDGLTRVFRELAAARPGRVDEVFAAQTSEGFWGRDFNYAYLRNPALMPEPLALTLVGADLGDMGSAAGAAALVLTLESFEPPVFPRPTRTHALVYGAADTGLVGGCIISGRS